MIHSDQGFHYTNPEYISTVAELGMIQSMSRKGNCIDNAPMESFFGHLKDEVDYQDCRTFAELDLRVEEYVKYYNQERKQWELKKMTPVAYRNHLLTRQWVFISVSSLEGTDQTKGFSFVFVIARSESHERRSNLFD